MSCTTATTGPQTRLTLADLEETVKKLRGVPPAKWLLVSPNGTVWADADPMKLAHILAGAALRIGPVAFGQQEGE